MPSQQKGKTKSTSPTPTKKPYRLVGLTGGIASGKSSVAEYLKTLGHAVVDADKIVHGLLAPEGKAHELVKQAFGTADRKILREAVFQSEEKRKALESILHPLVAEESQRQFRELGKSHSLIFYEATLLIEAGRHQDMDAVWVTTAPESTRLERIIARNGYTKQQAQAIIHSQSTDAFRLAHATREIKNEGSLTDLRAVVDGAIAELEK